MPWQALADAVLLLHFGIVLFVVLGLPTIVVGNRLGWPWVNRWGFRLAHLAAIGVVVLQSWLGQACVLTTLESWLRVQAGSTAYTRSFIEHWVQRVMFYEAPFWVFATIYTVFGALVVLAWWQHPPRRRAEKAEKGTDLLSDFPVSDPAPQVAEDDKPRK